MSVCAQVLSLGDDWSIHLKRGRVGGRLIRTQFFPFSLLLAYRQQISLTNGKQGLVPEEMSQTLMTNEKQGKTSRPQTLSSQPSFVFTGRNMDIPTENQRSPKTIETSRDPYLGL
jgi:hypothetical protein